MLSRGLEFFCFLHLGRIPSCFRFKVKPKHRLKLIFRAQHLHSKNTGCFGAWNVSEFCCGKTSPFFTSPWRHLFCLACSFLWTPLITLEKLEGLLRSFFLPQPWGILEMGLWPYAIKCLQQDLHSSASETLGFPPAMFFSFTFFTKWTTDVLLCHTSQCMLFQEHCAVFLPAPAAAAPPALVFWRDCSGMEAPCSGLVWWAYCCVSKCSVKAETEDT